MTETATPDPLPCLKRPFASEVEANAEIQRIKAAHGHAMRAYRCNLFGCDAWHMTKAVKPTRRARFQRRT